MLITSSIIVKCWHEQFIFAHQVNVNMNPGNGKIVANEREQSSASHIYAIGDMLDGKPELTPVAIQVKRLLR